MAVQLSVSNKHWNIRSCPREQANHLAREAGVHPVLAELFHIRGMRDPGNIRDFLAAKLTQLHDPEELPGVTAAAGRIHEAITEKQKIIIFGDYDVDGISGTSLLLMGLKLLGADVSYYVPDRLREGYGLSIEGVEKLAQRGAEVVITVDCGITATEAANLAHQRGIDLIITDHHHPRDQLPKALAIVHPKLSPHDYPFPELCGSGVALKLAWAVCRQASGAKRVSERMKEFLLQAVALAALGTVADVVPLVDENRVLVRHGLVSLADRPTIGLAALLDVCKLSGKRFLDSEDFGFALAPRLNAAGRFGQAQLAVELLTTQNQQRSKELASYMDELNETRKTLERRIYLAALKQAKEEFDLENDPAFVLAGFGWHQGVIGIVAGRLAEKLHRPVVLVAFDQVGDRAGTGSARSVPDFNLHAALTRCAHLLQAHGGHAAAAGLTLHPSQLAAFRAEFCEVVAEERPEADSTGRLDIDGELPLSAFSMKVMEQLEQMAPFGAGNPRPLWCTSGVTLAEPPRKMGNGDRHLSLQIVQHRARMRAVAFGQGEWAEELSQIDSPLDIAFRPVINTFRGQRSIELHLVDWRPTRRAE